MRELKNVSFVANCGSLNRVIRRIDNICYIGCFKGTKDEAIRRIKNDYSGQSQLDYIEKIEQLFDTDYTDFKDITANDNHTIRWASKNGQLEVVKYLVENGADITAENNYAIRWASYNGHLEVVKFLYENGADITAENNHAICLASRYGHLEVVKFLYENGADITADYNYSIRWASYYGHFEIVKFLLRKLNKNYFFKIKYYAIFLYHSIKK